MDKKYLDRVSEAIRGDLGEKRKLDVQKRFDWILEQVSQNGGVNILDVGCSQGALEFELLKSLPQGGRIIGVDATGESIDYANRMLEECPDKDRIEFRCMDFMLFPENEQYDTVIIAEVLEHLNEPEKFIEKSSKLLSEEGSLIITVPFAINDFPDHKRTYYLALLYEQVTKYIPIVKYQILGNWIGVVASKAGNSFTINEEVLSDVEQGFFSIERELRDKLVDKNKRIKKLELDREKLKEKIQEKDTRIDKLSSDREILRERVKVRDKQILELKRIIQENS